jgi:hypothetical protein
VEVVALCQLLPQDPGTTLPKNLHSEDIVQKARCLAHMLLLAARCDRQPVSLNTELHLGRCA